MVKKIIDTKGSEFLEPLQNMNLSLQIGPDRFTYLVNSKQEILILSVFEWQNEPELLKTILNYLENDHINLAQFGSISLSVIPTDEKEALTTDDNLQLESIQQYFKHNFPTAQIKDAFGTMLHAFKTKYPLKSVVFSYWQSGKIFLCAMSYGAVENKISSTYFSAEDALYYVLQFYKLNNLSTDKDPLYISGSLIEDSAIYRLLYNYFAIIEFVHNPTELKLENAEDFPEHLFFDILSAIK